MFTSTDPAGISVTDGLRAAWQLLVRSWPVWLPVAVATGAAQLVLNLVTEAIDWSRVFTVDPATGRAEFAAGASSVAAPFLAGVILVAAIGAVSGWIYTGIAIADLRRRPLTLSWILERGVLTIAAGLLIALAFVVAFIVVLLAIAAAGPVGLLLFLVGVLAGIYAGIRLVFVALAVFDGCGPVEGIRQSWLLSSRSVLRMLGWGLVAIAIEIGYSIASGILVGPLSSAGARPLAAAISAVGSSGLEAYLLFFLAALYESQRARGAPDRAASGGAARV